jgi:hypothetical protein
MSIFDTFFDYKQCRCPSCLEMFYPGDCAIVSTVHDAQGKPGDIDQPDKLKVLKRAPAQGSLAQFNARRNPEPLTGDVYTRELAQRRCPHCGYLLPYNIENAKSMTIAIVGDFTSGKSIYISAMIKQIEEGKLVRTGQYTSFRCLTPGVKEYYKTNYFQPLFDGKQALRRTQATTETTHKPLIYELTVRPEPQRPAKHMNLIIYDTSGEDYMLQQRLVQYARYVLSADAIVYLADPVAMPEIADYLPSELRQSTALPRTPTEGLNNILQLLERRAGKLAGSSLRSIPIAIMLPKADLLKYVTPISQQYSFMRPHTYKGGIDLKELKIVDMEVRHLLQNYGGQTLLKAIPQNSRVRFFATSATGYAPDVNGNFPAIEPNRCLDPILWILHELGLLPADLQS